MHSLLARLGYLFARPALKRLKTRLDPRRYNGAVFLGLNKVAVKSHGGTDALGSEALLGLPWPRLDPPAFVRIYVILVHPG